MTPKLTTARCILREIKGIDLFGYYEILSDTETMSMLGGPALTNDLVNVDFVHRMRVERENGICYFWSITLKDEREFIGYIKLMSYNSGYYDASFSASGENKYDFEFQKYFDRASGWEIEYALIKSQRNRGIMSEVVGAVLEFCASSNIFPIYAKVYSIKNIATVKLLKHHNFQEHVPQIDEKLQQIDDLETIVKNKNFGMIFKWIP